MVRPIEGGKNDETNNMAEDKKVLGKHDIS